MEKLFIITDEDGMHARPAAAVMQAAKAFKSEVFAEAKGRKLKVNTLLDFMSLELEQGDILQLITVGEDAEVAMEALAVIMAEGLAVVQE